MNNAGLALGTDRVGSIQFDELDAMLETNVRGLIHMTQVFVKRFKERRSGHIINLGSIAGREAYPGGSIVRGIRGPLELTYAVLCDQVCRARLYVRADEGAVRNAHSRKQHPAGHGRDRVQPRALPRRCRLGRSRVHWHRGTHQRGHCRGNCLDRKSPTARQRGRGAPPCARCSRR